MNIRRVLLFFFVLGVVGCAGLQQFPEVSKSAEADLAARDPDYLRVQTRIEEAQGTPEKQKQIRNDEIDRRLRIIDLNFQSYQAGLAKENVQADFGVAVVQIGVGAVGALVSQTASQILSATSAGLAGVQAAYGKAALFNQALPALLAQMIASRKAILVLISEGQTRNLDEYPFSTAMRDLDAYYFAGSIPGAIVATSADATTKADAAEKRLRVSTFTFDESAKIISTFIWPPKGDRKKPHNPDNLQKIRDWMKKNELDEVATQKFLDHPLLERQRERAIREIPIP